MKKYLIVSFLFSFLCNAQINNMFPLAVGNKYQYFHYSENSNWGYQYSLSENEIKRDTVINGFKYYFFNDSSICYRYGSSEKEIFVRGVYGEGLYCDFDLPSGSVFSKYNPYFNIYHNTTITHDSTLYFGKMRKTVVLTGLGLGTTTFANELGEIRYSYSSGPPGVGYSYRRLINVIIKDSLGNYSLYSEGEIPTFIFEPVSYFQILMPKYVSAEISHKYNKISYFLGNPSIGIDYIESAYLEYYNFTDSLLSGVRINLGYRSGFTNEYKFSVFLDSSSFKPSHKLNYRIVVKDKALIPTIVYSPPDGYYQAFIYGPPVNIDEDFFEYEFQLHQNYPNPFNPLTKIKFTIPDFGFTSLKIYDVLGNEVAALISEEKQPGEYEVDFDGSRLSSGVYFYQLKAGEFIQTNKMILMR